MSLSIDEQMDRLTDIVRSELLMDGQIFQQFNKRPSTLQMSTMRENNLSPCREQIEKILQEAPGARKALLENQSNLLRVADYCQNKNLNVDDSRSVIEEAKALTTQALASVTYQISSLATSVLKLLDAQTVQMKQMESSVNMLTLTVALCKEKMARREIGVLTAQCKVPRTQKMIPPAKGPEPFRSYRRDPISYNCLDKLGHGHWAGNKNEEPKPESDYEDLVSFLGIAVAPPSVPDSVCSSIPPPSDLSPALASPSPISIHSPSLPPFSYPDLSMLPPPLITEDEMDDAPPPPPPPSPPPCSVLPPPPFAPPPPHPSGNAPVPPPPGSCMASSIPPPPPPPPGSCMASSLPPPPPEPSTGSSLPPPPQIPQPPGAGGKFIPPPPPPFFKC
ncbi:hypothetical protein DNTS_013441 [Danionella cerebrum]|uniref:Abl-interactor homeo-domain homologous domain-containing protein n=1 Tax=Danionella cerebrum TaxID=2873325 RepID=A0A553N3B2_9TELE|nr:hypothetical protein DNTS_013441 [Danionella translucida]